MQNINNLLTDVNYKYSIVGSGVFLKKFNLLFISRCINNEYLVPFKKLKKFCLIMFGVIPSSISYIFTRRGSSIFIKYGIKYVFKWSFKMFYFIQLLFYCINISNFKPTFFHGLQLQSLHRFFFQYGTIDTMLYFYIKLSHFQISNNIFFDL